MTQDQVNEPIQPSGSCATRKRAWLRAAKAYVLLHAVVSICLCILGAEHLVEWRWIPAAVYVFIKVVGNLGFLPFILSSPIVSVVMVSMRQRDREWLYLGICDAALLVLQIFGAFVAAH